MPLEISWKLLFRVIFVPVPAHPGHGRVVGLVDLLETQVAPGFGLANFANALGVLIRSVSGRSGRGALAKLLPDPSGAAAKYDNESQPGQNSEEDDGRPSDGR